jgi:hypothetical protein
MKFRDGFVSNSSSSSFMIGIAKVKDANAVLNFIKSHGLGSAMRLVQYPPAESGRYSEFDTDNELGRVSIGSFRGDEVSVSGLKDGDVFVVLDYAGSEGDHAFMDEWSNVEYDIDIGFFNANLEEAYSFFGHNNDIIQDGDAMYGAGRDG